MTPCASEPISYLRLERYALLELPEAERRAVHAHLADCAACRACFEETQRACALLPLRELTRHAPARRTQRARAARSSVLDAWLQGLRAWLDGLRARLAPARVRNGLSLLGALGAAAAAWLVLRPSIGPGLEPPELRSARLGVKGGELALELVRRHDGVLADAARFAEGDAFKVLVTCPPPGARHVDVVVYQGDEIYFPLDPSTLEHCGNRIALPGAFSLDGSRQAVVCAVVADAPIARAALARDASALPEHAVCRVVQSLH